MLETQVLSPSEQTQLTQLKAKFKADQLDIQIGSLEKAKQPVPAQLRLDMAETKLVLGHTGDVKHQLTQVDVSSLDGNQKRKYDELQLKLQPKTI